MIKASLRKPEVPPAFMPRRAAHTPALRPNPQLIHALLQRKEDERAHKRGACGCERCAGKRQNRLQRMLAVGPAHDPLEREADRVADRIAAMPAEARVARSPLKVQRAAPAPAPATEAPESVQRVLAAPGRPLDTGVRRDMEHRFGHDFSQVRVHHGSTAARSAADVEARAYTVGTDIVFGGGQFAPATGAGRRLLAHELTHVIQQSGSVRLQRQATPAAGAGSGAAGGAAAAPVCAATYRIPDDVHTAIGVAWGRSGHGQATVAEHGGRIVTDSAGKRQIRTGSGGSGSISLPAAQAGDVTTGTFHTHPYSTSEGSHLGMAFSGGDIVNFIAGSQGSVKYVGAGSCYYVLDTLSVAQRDACKTVDINKRWNDARSAAGGSAADQVRVAVKTAIAGCGLCFYSACRPDAASAVPKVANLQ